jgi:hypothetical protein
MNKFLSAVPGTMILLLQRRRVISRGQARYIRSIVREIQIFGMRSRCFMNHGTISKTVPWLKSVTFIEP